MTEEAPVLIRVPLPKPLTTMELSVVALLSEGWSEREAARILGSSHRVVKFHMDNIRRKIPGDLNRRARLIVWYRGAPLTVLQPTRSGAYDETELPPTMTRQGALKRALAISQGVGCPCCGYDGVVRLPDGPTRDRLGKYASNGVSPNGKSAELERLPGRDV